MPTIQHESIVQLFRSNPGLVVELVRVEFGLSLRDARGVIEDAKLPTLAPAAYEADLVVRVGDALAVVVEVQLGIDPGKRLSWPVYLANLRARTGLPVVLLVVTPSARVARWAAQPIEMGPQGWTLRPMVLGPKQIPEVSTPEAAKASPELAVLSALAHGRGRRGLPIATAAVSCLAALDSAYSGLYLDLILNSLNEAARLALERLMFEDYQIRNEALRNFLAQAEARGRAEGEACGRAEGEARGEAMALLEVLEARGVLVDAATRSRVMACGDLAQLRHWLKRAAHARTLAEVFGG